MDIIVTTPKSEMKNAAQEAADCIAAGGGYYFRRLPRRPEWLRVDDRIWYVEDGYVRGFGVVCDLTQMPENYCETTKRTWPDGWYVVFPADSWSWIEPIPMKGFQGFRYFIAGDFLADKYIAEWLDPKPAEPAVTKQATSEVIGRASKARRNSEQAKTEVIDHSTDEVIALTRGEVELFQNLVSDACAGLNYSDDIVEALDNLSQKIVEQTGIKSIMQRLRDRTK